jgi:chromosomal replication initiator protein
MNIEEAWTKTLEAIGLKVGNQAYELWFRPLKLVHINGHKVILEVPNKFFKEWIEDHYPGIISETIAGFLNRQVTINYKVFEKKEAPVIKKIESRQENRRAKLASRGIYLNPKFIFDTFVVSCCCTGHSGRAWQGL